MFFGFFIYRDNRKLIFQRFPCTALISPQKYCFIGGPGFMSIQGGIFNPGAIIENGKIFVIARGEKIAHRDFPKNSHKQYLDSFSPVLMRFNNAMQLECAENLFVRFLPENMVGRLYDPRLFKFQGVIYANLCFDYFERLEGQYSEAIKNHQYRVVIAELNIKERALQYKGEPRLDFPKRKHEKNWAFFEHNGELYMLYSLSPYILLKATDWARQKFETVIGNPSTITRQQEFSFRLTTNPIAYDEKYYLFLFHGKIRSYLFWAMLIDKKTLKPIRVSSRPVFISVTARGHNPMVVYPSSLVILNNEIVFFLGEGDSHLSYSKINKKTLDAVFIPYEEQLSLDYCWQLLKKANEER